MFLEGLLSVKLLAAFGIINARIHLYKILLGYFVSVDPALIF